MELHAEDVAGFEHGGVGQRVSAGRGGLLDHRHVVTVREVDVRVFGQPFEQSRRPHASSWFQPMCGTRADVEALHLAGKDAEAALFGRFFAGSNSPCRPRQIPRNGTPAWMRPIKASRTFISSSARSIWPKWPTPGRMIFDARSQSGGIAHQFVSRADLIQRVLHRAQIAGAVIEDRNHNRPLVDGSWSFSRASFEQA